MPSQRAIRNRIRGVQSIAKITRAMEMIAALRMRRAQERGLEGRAYAEKITQVISDLAALHTSEDVLHPLLQRREIKNIAIVQITPDRGLCGGLIGNINRRTSSFILEQAVNTSLVVVGRKGVEFMRRARQNITAEFTNLGDRPSLLDTLPISRIIIDDYTNGTIDGAYIAYTQFVNTLVQKATILPILPVQPATIRASENVDYIYEPNADLVLNGLLPRFIEMQIHHAVLEAIASEQSARMVAMRSATENAQDLMSELTLVYNKVRQETITKELLDITAGAEALA
ncbi:MAG TPA: ATP synthase F1 subunit gamma [Dehalococcoidales bacterium]|nr:ATP synthase F1 subunit gamma [Dehalococcoidales bacterium]